MIPFRFANFSTMGPDDSLQRFIDLVSLLKAKANVKTDNNFIINVVYFRFPAEKIRKEIMDGQEDIFREDKVKRAVEEGGRLFQIDGIITFNNKDFSFKIGNKIIAGTDYVGFAQVREKPSAFSGDLSDRGELVRIMQESFYAIFAEFYGS